MVKRRSVLATVLGGGLAAWWALGPGRALGRGLAAGGRTPGVADLAERLVGALGRPDSAAAVGRAYLARFPEEAVPARLVAGIAAAWEDEEGGGADGGGFDPARADRAALRRRRRNQLRRDFARGRVVSVDGWVLAATEARLFALAALRHHQPWPRGA